MSQPPLDELYQEAILEHFRHSRNRGRVENPDIVAEGANPLCGDELTLTARLEDGRLREIRFDGQGCAISQASASMLAEALEGRTPAEAAELARRFKDYLLSPTPVALPGDLTELAAFHGLRKLPIRAKCALLGWHVLLEGLKQIAVPDASSPAKSEL